MHLKYLIDFFMIIEKLIILTSAHFSFIDVNLKNPITHNGFPTLKSIIIQK